MEKGADVNLEDKYGQTCIFYAIREGHYDIVEFLIKHGANVNKIDKKKQTPVSFAMKHNKDKIVELLVNNGGRKPEPKAKGNKEKNKKVRKSQPIQKIIIKAKAKLLVIFKLRENTYWSR